MLDESSFATLHGWLAQHNVTDTEPTLVGDMVRARLTVDQAEAMFATKMHRFTRMFGQLQHSVIRATSYTVPEPIASAVKVVGDLVHFPAEPRVPIVVTGAPEQGRKLLGGGAGGKGKWANSCTGAKGTGCKGLVEPGVLRKRYSLGTQPTKVSANSSIAVAEFQGQYYKDSDIAEFS